MTHIDHRRPATITTSRTVGPAVPAREVVLSGLATAERSTITFVMGALTVVGSLVVGVLAADKPKLGVALVIAVAGALVVLRRMEYAGLILVTLVPDLSGLKRGWPIPGLRLTEALTAGLAVLVFLFLRRSQALPWTRLEWLAFGYAAVGFVLGVYDARQLSAPLNFSSIGTLIGPLQFFLLFRTIRLVTYKPSLRQQALRLLLLSSVPVSVLALLQQANVPKIRTFLYNFTGSDVLAGPGSGYQTFARATGPFSHWTPLAGYEVVILVVGLTLILDPACRILRRRMLYAVLLLDAVTLAFTAELSALLGMALALLLVGHMYGQLGRVLRATLTAVVVLAILSGPYLVGRLHQEYTKKAGTNHSSVVPQTIEFRLNIWEQQYFPAIGLRPVTGYGATTPAVVNWPATESQYVTVLERGGAIFMAMYIALTVGLITTGLAVARASDDPSDRVTGYSVATLGIILIPMNVVFPYFEDSGMPQALWALVGIMMAGSRGALPRAGLPRIRNRTHRAHPTARTTISDLVRPNARSLSRIESGK